MTIRGIERRHNLLRHDATIVVNAARATFSSWTDRALAIFMVTIALFGLPASLAHQPFVPSASIVTAVAAMIGAGTGRLIRRRLDFHAYDGVLAADALAGSARRSYALFVHLLSSCVLAIGLLVARPGLVAFAAAGYLLGAGCGHLAARLARKGRGRRGRRPGRSARRELRRPTAGLAAAMVVLPVLLLLSSLEPAPFLAAVGAISAIAALSLTIVDDAAVRFMTISGYRAWAIVGIRARAGLIFLAAAGAGSLILAGPLPAQIVVAVTTAALALMAARILAYRVHARRTADMVLSLSGAGLCAIGLAAPILLPPVLAAIFWHLHRRAAPMTWMLP